MANPTQENRITMKGMKLSNALLLWKKNTARKKLNAKWKWLDDDTNTYNFYAKIMEKKLEE